MQIFSGQSISSDVVFGPLHFLTPAPPTISAHSPLPPEEEWERFSTAHRQAVLELAQLYDQAVQMVGEKLAYQKAQDILRTYQKQLTEIAEYLLANETMNGDVFESFFTEVSQDAQ